VGYSPGWVVKASIHPLDVSVLDSMVVTNTLAIESGRRDSRFGRLCRSRRGLGNPVGDGLVRGAGLEGERLSIGLPKILRRRLHP